MSTFKRLLLSHWTVAAVLLFVLGTAAGAARQEQTLGQDATAAASAFQGAAKPGRVTPRPPRGRQYHLGATPTPGQIAGWNIDVRPDGRGLPPGSGSVTQGKAIYAQKCASCHGVQGQGKPMDQLVGGRGTLNTAKPVKTLGSYWPYATSIFDYIHRAMPFNAPGSLTPGEVYAVTAYLLNVNGVVPAHAVMNAHTLPKVRMPNRNGFYQPDPRPDTHNRACLTNCPAGHSPAQ